MLVLFAHRRGALDQRRKLRGGFQRLLDTGMHDRARNAACKLFLPVFLENRCHFVLFSHTQPLRRTLPARPVHAHVERTVVHKTETPVRLIQLRRRNPQVQQDSINLLQQTLLLGVRQHLREAAVHHGKTRITAKTLARRLYRGLVLIKTDQAALLAKLLKDQSTVTAAPEGAIYIDTLGFDLQRLDRLAQQHRLVSCHTHQKTISLSCSDKSEAASFASPSHSSRLPAQADSSQISNLWP